MSSAEVPVSLKPAPRQALMGPQAGTAPNFHQDSTREASGSSTPLPHDGQAVTETRPPRQPHGIPRLQDCPRPSPPHLSVPPHLTFASSPTCGSHDYLGTAAWLAPLTSTTFKHSFIPHISEHHHVPGTSAQDTVNKPHRPGPGGTRGQREVMNSTPTSTELELGWASRT